MTTSHHSNMPENNLHTICIRILSYLAVLILLLHKTEGYSIAKHMDVDKIEHNCPELDNCKYRNESKLLYPTIERSCACDATCYKFDDCCIDALKLNGEKCDMECYDVKGVGGIYMVGKCRDKYDGDESWRELCEDMDVADPSDPIGSVPVSDYDTGVTYKNVYCKLCNGKFDLMRFWKTKLDFPFLSSFNESYSITDEYILKNLVKMNNTWGLNLEIEDDMFFLECNIETVIPSSFRNKIRRCKASLISDCPPSWENEVIRKKCETFQGPRYTDYGDGYRNIYCAICNNVNAADLSCLSPQSESIKLFRFSIAHSFALLLDVNLKGGEKVGMVKLCKSGEVYDPFFKKCRELQCLPGFVRRGRKCFPRRSIRKPSKYRKAYVTTTTSTSKPYTSSVIPTTLESAFVKANVNYTAERSTVLLPSYDISSYTTSKSPLQSKSSIYAYSYIEASVTKDSLNKYL